MNFIVGPIVATMIQAKYPGGYRKFEEEGGQIGIAPGTTKEVVIHHPGLPEDLKKSLQELLDRWKLTIRFAQYLNGQGSTMSELPGIINAGLQQTVKDTGIEEVAVSIHPLLCIFTILSTEISEAQAEAFAESLKVNIPSLCFGYVIYVDGYVCIERDPSKKLLIAQEHSDRKMVLSDDDLLNLKISLNNVNSVEDFINNM